MFKTALIISILFSSILFGKIVPPPTIESVEYDGLVIKFPHIVQDSDQFGGWVEVIDKKTNLQKCLKKIYQNKKLITPTSETAYETNFIYRIRHIAEIITVYDSHNDVHKVIVSDICK